MTTRAVVFGGGGPFGISWETGLAIGLAEAGIYLTKADFFVGTSAGGSTAVQINSGLTPEELLQRQVNPSLREREISAPRTLKEMTDDSTPLRKQAKDYKEALQLVGRYALDTVTVTEEERLAVISERLRLHNLTDWPSANIAITVVDAYSGERVVLTRESGVPLAKAIAATGALPGIWPPITIGDTRYIDGGVYSFENADLATGYDRVLIVQAFPTPFPETAIEGQIQQLEKAGSRVSLIAPSEAVMTALLKKGGNPLDSSIREEAALLGRQQGRKEAVNLAEFWD